MPTKVGIHDFPCRQQQSRGWRAFARHDDQRHASVSLFATRYKIAALTECVREKLGAEPRIHKAGRYGLDIGREATLRRFDWSVDTGIPPYRDRSDLRGGPDFFDYPDEPFCTNPDKDFLLYPPVTQCLIGPSRDVAETRLARWLLGRRASRMHIPGFSLSLHSPSLMPGMVL